MGRLLEVPENILNKAPNDGLGALTDEEKMGVTYKQISEMIETGTTNAYAKERIIRMFKASSHKRRLVEKYEFDRENYLLNMD